MTSSEEFVFELCKKSFLPFWSYPCPLGKKGKELCDILIVCQNIVIIISIKDIKVSNNENEEIQYERWKKKAIVSSVDQIYGAERFLETVTEVTLKDKKIKIELPSFENRKIFRIAIAFGGGNRFPLETGEYGKGFVHVFDEESTLTVINELDTIVDFVAYLKAKERFLNKKRILVPREIDFLALYLQTSLEFDFNPDMVVLDNNMWEAYIATVEYKNWQKETLQSYIWDEMVMMLYQRHIKEDNDNSHRDLEIATRLIALEPRINRIELGMLLLDGISRNIRARMVKATPESNHSYVFLKIDCKNWNYRSSELQIRCMIARKENPNADKVVGIAYGRSPEDENMFDIVYFDIPELTKEIDDKIEIAKRELGYFKSPQITNSKELR